MRLASDASAMEQMVGTRLGVFCETFALSCFGLLFGMLFNWQLTMIVFLTFLFIGAIAYLDVRLNKYVKKKSGSILQRANTVRLDFDLESAFIFDKTNTLFLVCSLRLKFYIICIQ
jgi:hypothetical protein